MIRRPRKGWSGIAELIMRDRRQMEVSLCLNGLLDGIRYILWIFRQKCIIIDFTFRSSYLVRVDQTPLLRILMHSMQTALTCIDDRRLSMFWEVI